MLVKLARLLPHDMYLPHQQHPEPESVYLPWFVVVMLFVVESWQG